MQHKVLFADTWKMSNMFKHSYMQASMSNDILGTVSINKAKNKLQRFFTTHYIIKNNMFGK